jgi:hypothetical protein
LGLRECWRSANREREKDGDEEEGRSSQVAPIRMFHRSLL